MRSTRVSIMVLAALAAAGSSPVLAQRSAEVIDLQADRIELQDRAQRVTFSGNVRARQGAMVITAASATVTYSGQALTGNSDPEIQRIDARGDVVVTRPAETARGDFAIYDFDRRIVTLVGHVTLRRQGTVVNGARLSINLDTDRAVMNGSAGSTSSSATPGRVTGTFSVPKRASDVGGVARD